MLPGYYFLIAIAVGVVLGYFLSGYIKDLALTIVYSIQGGFLLGSCVSYTFWQGSEGYRVVRPFPMHTRHAFRFYEARNSARRVDVL